MGNVNLLWVAVCVCCLFCAGSAQTLCGVDNKTLCGSSFCNFPLFTRSACDFTWTSVQGTNFVPFMCVTSNLTGTCERCPSGWSSSGAFCAECDPVKSCNRDGVASCLGACSAGNYPVCEAFVNRVNCISCAVNSTDLRVSHKRLTRGGILDAPDLCAAYFQCDVGYYLFQSSTRVLSCIPCVFPEAVQSSWVFVSRGLTFGDAYSCAYKPLVSALNGNTWGQYGSPLQSCPPGKTSQPLMALTSQDCATCPSPPLNGGFSSGSFECIPECKEGYTRVGEACVLSDAAAWDCQIDGYESVTDSSGKSVCAPQPLPWNPPGYSAVSSGELNVTVVLRAQAWAAWDETGDFRVVQGQNKLARWNVTNFCSHLVSTLPNTAYVQDRPLSTFICSETERHEYYLLANGAKYLYAFLERSFGNNNRFVLWQVQKQKYGVGNNFGQVWQRWRLPAKVCSAVVVPGDVVYMAFCDTPFLSYVVASDFMGSTDIQYDVYSQGVGYWLGRRVGILIGQDMAGQRDGMRDQALFSSSLSLTVASDPKRLFVADKGNCRVVEVVVDAPGSYLTRATTVGQGYCFSGAFPLPYPRLISSVLGGSFFLMVTDRGLVQLDASTRVFVQAMSAWELSAAVSNIQWMTVTDQGHAVVFRNATHDVWVARKTEKCPSGQVSKRGGFCFPCPEGTFAYENACRACTVPACPVNHSVVACTASQDASCVRCSGTAPYAFRYAPDCGLIPIYPCPAGFWGLSDCQPCASKVLGALPSPGVCQCLGVPLTGNGTECVIQSPYAAGIGNFSGVPAYSSDVACTYLDENCTDQACYLAQVHPRRCQVCPEGYVGLNGFWCQPCGGFRDPSPSRDYCVCRLPAEPSDNGSSCVCPAGFAAGGAEGCVACLPGKIKATATVLSENVGAAVSGGACMDCPAGSEPDPVRSGCIACEEGKFRQVGMAQCEKCPGIASFARDARLSSSCVACESACASGKKWSACPVNASWFVCEECPVLNRFKRMVARAEDRNCEWECVAGFYELNGECWPCTRKTCSAGYKETLCSKYEDSHCRLPCTSDTKPREHSVWLSDCKWDCEVGFTKVLREYPGWAEYECVVSQDFTSNIL